MDISHANSPGTDIEVDPLKDYPFLIYILIGFAFIVIFMIVTNMVVTFKCEIYDNCSSGFLMIIMELLLFTSLMDLCYQIFDQRQDYEFQLRIAKDIPTYLFSVIAVVLLFQWAQTYSVLLNPTEAYKTLQNNTQFKFQIVFICIYSMFLIFDVVIAWMDFNQQYDSKQLVLIDKTFLGIFTAQNLVTMVLYLLLFVLFRRLIKERGEELESMRGHVNGFFTFMILIQAGSLALSAVFYIVNDPTVDKTDQ